MNNMDTLSTSDSLYEFIELDRTFYQLSKHSSESDDLYIRRISRVGGLYHWDNLIKEFRLIILSEAGSGKTYEIRNVAQKLRNNGKKRVIIKNIQQDGKKS